jgi:hypothetical protein
MAPVRARRASIDLILFRHSHQELLDTMINGMLLMQPKNWATRVAGRRRRPLKCRHDEMID